MIIVGMEGKYNYKGIPLPEAYARIDVVSSHDTHCSMSVNVYTNKESFDNGFGYIEQLYPVEFEKDIGEGVGDDRTQGYQFILTNEYFTGWQVVRQ